MTTTRFSDICTNPARYDQIGQRKFTVTVDDLLYGIVLATKGPSYDSFALNEGELRDLLAARRAGRIAGAVIVAITTYSGGTYNPTYFGEIDAEKLATKLEGVEPRHGRFGKFYTLDNYTFADGDAAF
jgi:hypothetical protein